MPERRSASAPEALHILSHEPRAVNARSAIVLSRPPSALLCGLPRCLPDFNVTAPHWSPRTSVDVFLTLVASYPSCHDSLLMARTPPPVCRAFAWAGTRSRPPLQGCLLVLIINLRSVLMWTDLYCYPLLIGPLARPSSTGFCPALPSGTGTLPQVLCRNIPQQLKSMLAR